MTRNTSTWIKEHSIMLYFILAYALSWCVEIPLALYKQGVINTQIPMAIHYLNPFGPMVAALVMLSLTEGKSGVRALIHRWFKWQVKIRFYAFAILGPITLFTIAILINRVTSGTWPDLSLLGEADYLPYVTPFGALMVWLFTYGLGEESGWRGFALPHLQRKYSAAKSTFILAMFWAFWHVPAFFYRDTYIEMGMLGFPMFLVSITFTSMVFTWLYNSTGGSLLLVILFHAFFNWLTVSEAGGASVGIIMSMPVIVWALYVVRHYGVENVAPIERQMA